MSYRYHCDNHSKVMVAAGVPEWFSKTHTCRRASTQKPKEAEASEQDNNEQGLWTEGVGGGAYNQNIPNRRATLGLSGRDLSCISLSTPRLKVVVPPELGALLFPWLEAAEAAYALRLAADKRNMVASLVDCFKLLRTMRPVYFQIWAARLAAGDVPLTAYVLRHPLLAGTGFAAFAATMVTALRSVEDRANEAAEQVLPQLAPTVKAAIKAVAPSTLAQLQDAEIYMAAQVDASTLAIQAHARQTAADAMEHANVGVATVKRHTTKEVAELRKEVSHLRDVVLALLRGPSLGAASAAAGQPAADMGGLASAPSWPGPSEVHPPTRAAPPSIPLPPPPTRSAPTPTPAVSSSLLCDRVNVRELQLLGKLTGVSLLIDGANFVPILPMGENLSWLEALDEYASGVNGRAAIRDVEERLGSRWRLMVQDKARKLHITKLYSRRLPLYRAFDQEYAAHGHTLGVAGVLSIIKQNIKDHRGAEGALKAMAAEYPASLASKQ